MKPENILPTDSEEANHTQPASTTSPKHPLARLRKWTHSFWLMIQRFFISSTSTPLWLPIILRPWYIGYLIAIVLQALIVSLIALVIHFYTPFSFIEAPILLGVVFLSLGWGPGPGILATISGGILFDLLAFPPYFSFHIYKTEDIIGIFLYLVVGITIGLMASQTQRARRQAQSASSKASTLQHQLYELFMQAPAPITVLRGPEHRFELVNPLTQHAVGEKQIIGVPMREALPEYVEQGIIDRLDQVYATGKSMTIPEMRAETRQYIDGKTTSVEQYFTVIYQPTRTPQGVVDGIVIFNVDVTTQVRARKQMEQVVLERDRERAHLAEVLLTEQASREVAENATRQSQAIFEAIADPVFIVDTEAGPRQMNAAGRELLGIPKTLATGALHTHEQLFELYDEQGQILLREDWPQAKILEGAVLRGPTAADVVMHTSSGGRFRLSVTGAPLRSETGEVIAAVLVCRDVTERRSLEQRLRQAEQVAAERANQLEAVFEAITDGVFILNTHRTMPRLNPAARELLEITNDTEIDLKQGAPFELLDEQGQPLPSQFWPEAYLLKGERLLSKDAMDVAFRIRRTGRIRALSITGAPLWSPEGEVSGAVLVCRDVTGRRQLERQTQESLQSLLILAESLVSLPAMNGEANDTEAPTSPIEVVAKRLVILIRSVLGCQRVSITTYDAHTQALRSTAVVGLPPEQERIWKERIPGFRLSDILTGETIQAQFDRGNAIALDMSKPPFDGQPNPYGIKTMLLVPMRLETRLVGILSLDYGGEDRQFKENEKILAKAVAELAALILERERLLEERAESQANVLALQEANRLKDEFIGIAGHELRTPLTTIKASVQLARRQIARFSKQEKALSAEGTGLLASLQTLLDRAERQVGMQNRLVNDLLDVSRVEVGKLELYPALHDLVMLVREVVEDQRALTSERQILFEDSATEEVLVQVDADRLRQVINNYLTNALKYSEAEKPIIVRVRVASRIYVEVEDKGPGLTQTQQQRIWERFYRVPGIEVRSGSGVGLGLGLHISRMLIERQGGQVGVRSTPGEGSIFWFSLPQAE